MTKPSRNRPYIYNDIPTQKHNIVKFYAQICDREYFFTDHRITAERTILLPDGQTPKLLCAIDITSTGVLPPVGIAPLTTTTISTACFVPTTPCIQQAYQALNYPQGDKGISLLLAATPNQLSYEWRIENYSALKHLQLLIARADLLTIDEDGVLRIEYCGQVIGFPPPLAWQTLPNCTRRYLNCNYRLDSKLIYSFDIIQEQVDNNLPIIINY